MTGTIIEKREIKVFTTPKQLRMIADKMEKEMPKRTCGDSTYIYAWSNKDIRISVHADHQEYFHHKETGDWV